MKLTASLVALLAMALASGCNLGPKYARPQVPAPPAWQSQPPWQVAAPRDGDARGAWWEIFHDAQLNAYEQQLLQANQSLAAARDRLNQARSLARVASAGYFPQLSADPGYSRSRLSGNRPFPSTTPSYPATDGATTLPFSISYEADLFGRVRRNMEAANASLQASAADLENVRLVLTAELAADYFTLRELDAEYLVVQESVRYQQKALELVQSRHSGGIANGLELAQQEALLDSTKTQLALVKQQRDQYEHAIAVLTGNAAPSFSVPANPLAGEPPLVPLGIPSEVLERRPDIAEAERLMAYQNAQVGVARSAFYPHITLGGSGGWQSRDIALLMNAPSLMWAVGADALQPLLQGGRNRANLAAARAAYDQSVANYRQAVLVAFQQVEDGISGLNTLSQAAATQAAAVEDARRQLEIATNRYTGGVTSYLEVITAQTTLLASQRLATQLLGQRLVTSVYLVKALGGGWDSSALKNELVHPRPSQAVQP